MHRNDDDYDSDNDDDDDNQKKPDTAQKYTSNAS